MPFGLCIKRPQIQSFSSHLEIDCCYSQFGNSVIESTKTTVMSILPVAVMAFLCFASALGDCEYEGQTYATDESWKPDACMECLCDSEGEPRCVTPMCGMPSCADWTTSPDVCCPYCPNGENCQAPDGTIIPAGVQVEISDGSTCFCNSRHYNSAICFMQQAN